MADLPGLFPLVRTSSPKRRPGIPICLNTPTTPSSTPPRLTHWRAQPQPSSRPIMPATQIPFCRELDATDVSPDEMSVLSDSRLK